MWLSSRQTGLRQVSTMSKLAELLDELCPDGVEYRPLGDLLNYEQPTKYLVKLTEYDDSFDTPVLTAGRSFLLGYTDEKEGIYQASGSDPVIIFDDFTTGFHWVDFDFKVKSSAMKMLRPKDKAVASFRYVLHAMRTIRYVPGSHSRQWISTYSKISIPVPPLEVQQEIVRVLDAFTDLEQSLVSELELRKKQFDSVRRSVISDSQAAEKKVLRLREAESEGIVTLGRGKVISKKDIAANPGDYPVYSSSGAGNGEFGRYGNYMFDDERISWSVDGGGRLFYRPAHRYSVTNVSGWMTVNISDLQVKYLYYVLLSQWENESFDYTRKAHPSVIREVYAFSIPTIEIQDEVVSKLDSLESLIQSIEQEISLRRKQYEFYRDELLSFTPKKD